LPFVSDDKEPPKRLSSASPKGKPRRENEQTCGIFLKLETRAEGDEPSLDQDDAALCARARRGSRVGDEADRPSAKKRFRGATFFPTPIPGIGPMAKCAEWSKSNCARDAQLYPASPREPHRAPLMRSERGGSSPARVWSGSPVAAGDLVPKCRGSNLTRTRSWPGTLFDNESGTTTFNRDAHGTALEIPMDLANSDSEMQRFESCRPNRPVRV
jgi:hypothetical protein